LRDVDVFFAGDLRVVFRPVELVFAVLLRPDDDFFAALRFVDARFVAPAREVVPPDALRLVVLVPRERVLDVPAVLAERVLLVLRLFGPAVSLSFFTLERFVGMATSEACDAATSGPGAEPRASAIFPMFSTGASSAHRAVTRGSRKSASHASPVWVHSAPGPRRGAPAARRRRSATAARN
jgi:hypothetical protein